ncbi:MAG: aquaporin-like protein [Benniella sp.]|nr:MAG: aquaporin-like protein [Benniella sp.]
MSDQHVHVIHAHPEHEPLLPHTHATPVVYHPTSTWSKLRRKFKKAFAEFLGTAILVAFGTGAIAQLTFSPHSSWFTMSLGWGLGLTFGIYVSAGISGAHLNPAVTLSQAIFRGFAWADVPIYWVAQFLGAFFGALITYTFNHRRFGAADDHKTIGIFVTGRGDDNVSTLAAFTAELIGTAFLLVVILATSDKFNTPAGNVKPLIIGLSLAAIGNSFGYETGFALNPARDLAPRLLTLIAGWGTYAFTRQDWYFWIPIVAPFVGAVVGNLLYDVFVYVGPSPLND